MLYLYNDRINFFGVRCVNKKRGIFVTHSLSPRDKLTIASELRVKCSYVEEYKKMHILPFDMVDGLIEMMVRGLMQTQFCNLL